MEITRASVLELLYECIGELNELRSREEQLVRSPETALVGSGSGLDSLGFVNLIALVEEKASQRFGTTLVLSDAGGAAGAADPFASVGALADHIQAVLNGGSAKRE